MDVVGWLMPLVGSGGLTLTSTLLGCVKLGVERRFWSGSYDRRLVRWDLEFVIR